MESSLGGKGEWDFAGAVEPVVIMSRQREFICGVVKALLSFYFKARFLFTKRRPRKSSAFHNLARFFFGHFRPIGLTFGDSSMLGLLATKSRIACCF